MPIETDLTFEDIVRMELSGLNRSVDFFNDGETSWLSSDWPNLDHIQLPDLEALFDPSERGEVRWNFIEDHLEIYDGQDWHIVITKKEVKRIHDQQIKIHEHKRCSRFEQITTELYGTENKEIIKQLDIERSREIVQEVIEKVRKSLDPSLSHTRSKSKSRNRQDG